MPFYHDPDDAFGPTPFRGFTPNFERIGRLVQLSPLDAVRAWLALDFGFDEEPALCFAIRKDPGVELSDAALVDVFFEILDMDELGFDLDDEALADLSAQVLDLLREASAAVADRARAGRRR